MSEDLARRAVACKHWRWVPGMLAVHAIDTRPPYATPDPPYRAGDPLGRYLYTRRDNLGQWARFTKSTVRPNDAHPDLTDPATLGCLLALVEEALKGLGAVSIIKDGTQYEVRVYDPMATGLGSTLFFRKGSDALVAALEAAP